VIEAGGYEADIDPRIEESDTSVDLQFVNLRSVNALEEILNTYDVDMESVGYTISETRGVIAY
jgi:hypothetical protein